MIDYILTTYDWVPEFPRGYVRDLRVRWALEEAGLSYHVETTPFDDRGTQHFAHQPFGQVPWLTDGTQTIFESGAILLYLGERNERLMPSEAARRAQCLSWTIAALNSIEVVVLPYFMLKMSNDAGDAPFAQTMTGWLASRLAHLEIVLASQDWLAGEFSIADILMADALRLVERLGGLEIYPVCRAYVARTTARPAFRKAHADQMAHFAKGDQARA